MQNFLKRLGNLFFADDTQPAKEDLRGTNRHLKAAQVRRRSELLNNRRNRQRPAAPTEEYDADSELGYTIEDGGPGKNVLSRPKYLREDTGTHESLRIVDADLTDGDDDGGFDPYNTGKFDRSANWSRHVRK